MRYFWISAVIVFSAQALRTQQQQNNTLCSHSKTHF